MGKPFFPRPWIWGKIKPVEIIFKSNGKSRAEILFPPIMAINLVGMTFWLMFWVTNVFSFRIMESKQSKYIFLIQTKNEKNKKQQTKILAWVVRS